LGPSEASHTSAGQNGPDSRGYGGLGRLRDRAAPCW